MSLPKRFTNNSSYYHFVGTQQSGQGLKKSQQPAKLTQQTLNSDKKTQEKVYATVQETKAYARALRIDIMSMYTTAKGKPTYAKEDTSWARVRPRNSNIKKNKGFQATDDIETQENREKIKEKKHPIP
jgi:hypothetical protein